MIYKLDDFSGNYTIKLTVKDQEGESDSALASLVVLEETDYPPKVREYPNSFWGGRGVSYKYNAATPHWKCMEDASVILVIAVVQQKKKESPLGARLRIEPGAYRVPCGRQGQTKNDSLV